MTDNMSNNENIQNEQESNQVPSNEAYIEAIKNLKATTVSREQYEQLQNENKTLLQNLVNGQYIRNADSSSETPAEPKKPISELRKELFKPEKELNDIEYVTKALELRQRLLDEQGIDCFVGSSHNLTPTQSDYDTAEKTARILQECIDDSNGNNKMFIAHLQDRMLETSMPRRR